MVRTEEPVKNQEDPIPLAEGGVVTQDKACQILKDGNVQGQPLTPPQKRFFSLICGGGAPTQASKGAVVLGFDDLGNRTNRALTECLLEDPEFLDKV